MRRRSQIGVAQSERNRGVTENDGNGSTATKQRPQGKRPLGLQICRDGEEALREVWVHFKERKK